MTATHDTRGNVEATVVESTRPFDASVLDIDCEAVVDGLVRDIRKTTGPLLKRRGLVLGVSGGIDSAVCAALAVRALGPQRVCALLMPEQDSSSETTPLGELVCSSLGLTPILEDISPVLAGAGSYERRDEAIRRIFPQFGDDWRVKLVVADGLLDTGRVNYFKLVVQSPDGEQFEQRAPLDVYFQVVAATNMKQRTRKMIEYYHAERLNYAVLGTPNRLEFDLGFFVRGGDGLSDAAPIAHLYKSQVYALAEFMDVPSAVRSQPPSTDTYSLPQTQEEFYFALPYGQMDLLLWAHTNAVDPERVATTLKLTPAQVEHGYRDIEAKQRKSASLRLPPVVLK